MATSTALASFCPETQSLELSAVASIEALPQQEWSGPWNWRNAESEWCNTEEVPHSLPVICHRYPVLL